MSAAIAGARGQLVEKARQFPVGAFLAAGILATAMGRGLMPRYGDKIKGTDRWDVVNYVRTLQLQARGGAQ